MLLCKEIFSEKLIVSVDNLLKVVINSITVKPRKDNNTAGM